MGDETGLGSRGPSARARKNNAGLQRSDLAKTAHAMVGDKESCLSGMDGYVSKAPCQPKELFCAQDVPCASPETFVLNGFPARGAGAFLPVAVLHLQSTLTP